MATSLGSSLQQSRLRGRIAAAINAIDSPWEALMRLDCTFGDRLLTPDLVVVKSADLPVIACRCCPICP